MPRVLVVAVCGLLATAAAAQNAGVYKWVDAQGRTHYDDSNVIEQRLTQDYLNARGIPAQDEATTPRDFIEAVKRRCDTIRDRLQTYQRAARLEGRDPSGASYVLSPRQVQIEIAMSEREAARYCAPDAAARLYREPAPRPAADTNIPVERR